MSDKHTPGPWEVGEFETPMGTAFHIIHTWHDEDEGLEHADEIAEVVMDYRGDVARKNAELMAAAPEMLEAAKSLLRELKHFERETSDPLRFRSLYPQLSALQTASNKADGK